MTKTVNYKAADGFVLCWIPEELRPINILAQWNELKDMLADKETLINFPRRVFNGVEDEYVDILPYQADEIEAEWRDRHPEPNPDDSGTTEETAIEAE